MQVYNQQKEEDSLKLRQRIFITLTDAYDSPLAFGIAIYITIMVLISVVTFLLGSLPQYILSPPAVLVGVQLLAIISLTIDYLLRLVTSPKWYIWIIEPSNIIDLLVIVPYYVLLSLEAVDPFYSSFAAIQVLRLFAILRLFRLGLFFKGIRLLQRSLYESLSELLLFLILLFIIATFYSTLIYFAEQTVSTFDTETETWIREDGSISPYQSIPGSYFSIFMTITGVGADQSPISAAGQTVFSFAAVTGTLLIAFPIGILTAHFADKWAHYQKKKRKLKEEEKSKRPLTPEELSIELRLIQSELRDKLISIEQRINRIQNSLPVPQG